MNSLPLLIYFAQVSGNIQTVCGLGLAATIFGYVGWWIAWGTDSVDSPPSRRMIYGLVALSLLCATIPDRRTIYTVVAADAAQRAAATPQAQELLDLAVARIRDALKEETRQAK